MSNLPNLAGESALPEERNKSWLPDSHEKGVFPYSRQRAIMRTMMHDDYPVPPIDPELPEDLVLAADLRVRSGLPHEKEYPFTPEPLSRDLDNSPDSVRAALEVVGASFPGAELKLLSTFGSGSIVLEDGQRVYKVRRNAHVYSYIEDEAAAAVVLHSLVLGPRPWVLIDALPEYRSERTYRASGFTDVPIARVEGKGDLPVLVTDKVNAHPVTEITDERLMAEFNRVTRAMLDNRIMLGDTELVYDPDLDVVQVIDAGGLERLNVCRKYTYDASGAVDIHPELSDDAFIRASIVAASVQAFLMDEAGCKFIQASPERVHAMLEDGGLNALHQRMLEVRAMPTPADYSEVQF